MWQWSKSVGEYAAAASWTVRHANRTRPTITDPEHWASKHGIDEAGERLAHATDFALAR